MSTVANHQSSQVSNHDWEDNKRPHLITTAYRPQNTYYHQRNRKRETETNSRATMELPSRANVLADKDIIA
jgi:hypothetical protein